CEARLESCTCTLIDCSFPFISTITLLFGSELPKGVNTEKVSLARPSQKLRTLNTASMTVGVLRPVTRRVLTPPRLKAESNTEKPASSELPGTTSVKVLVNSPAEPITSRD